MAEATPNVTLSSVDPTALKDMVHSKHLSEAQKIEEATRQFEAVMLGMMLKESMQSQFEGYLDPSGANKNIYGTTTPEERLELEEEGIELASIPWAKDKEN